MKAFKINSKAALAVITTTLSLTLSPSAKPKKRVKIIKQLQLLMFLNNKKYNVHVLESDSFVYRGIAHIKSIEVEGDVQFIEELEVEVKKNHMKFLNIFQHL
jgi:phosphorylcholine metabolism protein LicD